MTALRFESVSFAYGAHPALHDVSFALSAGEGLALFGPNGAGKTTLSRLAMALLRPGSGRVETGGLDTRGRSPEDLAAVAGYLFQHPEAQLFERSVRAEVGFGPRRLGWPAARIASAVASVLDEIGLAAEGERHPYDLPAPRRRLVALATALVADPALLILDEPTAGLDRSARAAVLRVVQARRARGAAVLAITHDPGFAAEALDRGLVLERGRCVRDGPLWDLLGDPALGLPLPAPAAVARRLALPAHPPRAAAVAAAVAERCRALGASLS